MSRTVDQKVVEMKFDNKQFEQAVKESRQSIKLMEKDIQLLDGVKALKNLDSAIKSVDFTHMSKSIDRIKDSFSILGTIGRSVVNKLTTDAMNKFNQMTNKVSSAIKNVFNQVYTRGLNRANNLESSAFKIQGLLNRDKSLKDENKKLMITKKLSDMISDSVTDTAFGLDEASVAASTLASTFGTDDKALEKIRKTLNAISGIAGTTGASYQQIADIFTNASGKGVAMGDEFYRLSIQGVSAQEEIAKYVNNNLKYRKKLNKELGKSVKHEITGAEILKLAGKRKISAELFADAFEGFINTAKEANETLGGVTDNIGAAMGRLGALFLRPLVENSGPIVQFLQQVKNGISSITKTIDNLHIPDVITNFLSEGLRNAADLIGKFFTEFNKGTTPLNDFLDKVSKIADKLDTILVIRDKLLRVENDGSPSFKDLYDVEFDKEYNQRMKERDEAIGESYQTQKKLLKDLKNTSMSETDKIESARKTYLLQMTDGNLKTLDQWRELYREYYASQYDFSQMTKKQKKEILESDWFNNMVEGSAMKEYVADMKASQKEIEKISSRNAEINAEWEEIFSHNYFIDILEGIKNTIVGVLNVIDVFAKAIFGTSGPIQDLYNTITGDPREARKSLNSLTTGFKDATAKFKEFTKNNEGFKLFIEDIGKYIGIFAKILGGIFKIVGHLIVALSPLASKIADAFGRVFKTFSNGAESISLFDLIIDGICSAIDILVSVLEKAWDIAEKAFNWLYDAGVIDVLLGIAAGIIEFAKTAFTNWPKAWDMIKTGFKGFTEKAKEVAQWIGGKLKPVMLRIAPYVNNFADKVHDLTNGFIDLRKPLSWIGDLFGSTKDESKDLTKVMDSMNTTLGNVSSTADNLGDSIDKVKTGFASFSGFGGKNKNGINLTPNAMPVSITDIEKIKEQFTGNSENTDEDLEKAKGPFSWIIDFANWIKEQFAKITPEDVTNTIKNALKMFMAVAAIIATINISKGIKRIGEGLANLSAGITGFDVVAERRKRLAEVLKNIALIIGVFVAGIVVLSVAIWALGKIPEKQLSQGIKAVVTIGAMIIVLIVAIAVLSIFLQGRTKIAEGGANIFKQNKFLGTMSRQTNGPADITNGAARELSKIAMIMGIFVAGIILIAREAKKLGEMNPEDLARGVNAIERIGARIAILVIIIGVILLVLNKKGNPVTGSSMLKNVGMVMIGIAAILMVFVLSIKIIADLILDITEKGKTINRGNLDVAIMLIGGIAVALIALIAVIMLLSKGLLAKSSGLAPEKNQTIIYMLGMVALIIFVIGQAIGSIMRNLVAVIAVSRIGDMQSSMIIFGEIAGMMVLLVGAILGALVLMTFVMSDSPYLSDNKMRHLSLMLGIVAAIIFVFGQAIGSIIRNVTGMALTLSAVSSAKIEAITDILSSVMSGLIGFVAVVLLMAGIFSAIPTTNTTKLVATLAMVTAIMALFGGIIVALGFAINLCKSSSAEEIKSFALVALAAGAVIAIIIGVAGFFATRPTFDTGAMKSITLFVGSLAVLFVAIGAAIALASINEISDSGIAALAIGLAMVTIIIAIAFAIASFGSTNIERPMKALSKFVIALGILFVAIGAMALMVGKGVDLLATGIEKFVNTLNMLSGVENTEKFEEGARKLGEAFGSFLDGIADGIIKFGDKIDKKKGQLKLAIVKIAQVIRESVSTAFGQFLMFLTDQLTTIIATVATFLEDNKDNILSIIKSIEDIIVPALDHLLELIIQYAPNTIDRFMTLLEQEGPGFADRLAAWLANMFDQIVVSINKNMGTIVNAIQNLMKTIVNGIFMFFGMKPVFDDIETKAAEDAKSIEDTGKEIGTKMGEGFEGTNTEPFISNFVHKFLGALYNLITNSPIIKEISDFIAEMMLKLTGVEDYYNKIQGLQKVVEDGLHKGKAEIEEVNRQLAAQNHMTLENFKKTGRIAAYWNSQAGKNKLTAIAIKNGAKTYAEASVILGSAAENLDKATFERNLKAYEKYLKSNAFKQGTNIIADLTVNQIEKSLNTASGSHSPSTVMAKGPGKNMGDGVIVGVGEAITKGSMNVASMTVTSITTGLSKAVPEINKATSNMSNSLQPMTFGDMLKESFAGVGEEIRQSLDESGLFGDFFSIKPTVDLTNVEESKSSIQGIFDNMGLGVNVDGVSDMFGSLKSGNFSNLDVSSIASGFDSANGGGSSDLGSGESITNINFNQNNFSPESLSDIDIYRQTESLLGSSSTINGLMNAMGVKSSDLNLSFLQN